MSNTDAKRRATSKYRQVSRAQIVIDVSKAQRMQINDYCKPFGGTASYIKQLLRNDMLAHGVRPLEPNEEYVNEDTEA